jgi:recombination protein RecA
VIDEERTWDKTWAQKCGVDPERCWVGSGEYSEKSMDLAELLVGSGEFDAILIDSLAAMVPKKVRDEAHEDHQMGVEAKLNAKFFRKLLAAQTTLERQGKVAPTIFVINQIRKKIGIAYGNPEVLPGGEAQMYYASVWLDFRANETILNKNEDVVGMYFAYNIKKNKTAPPRRTGYVSMFIEDYNGMRAGDWDVPAAVIDLTERLQLIVKDGKWYKSPLLDKNYLYANLWNKLKVSPQLERKLVDSCNDLSSNPIKVAYAPRDGEELDAGVEVTEEEELAKEEKETKGKGKKK